MFSLEDIQPIHDKIEQPKLIHHKNQTRTKLRLLNPAFNNKQKAELFGELNLLLCAGLNLKSALSIYIESQPNKRLSEIAQSIQSLILKGHSLEQAMHEVSIFSTYELITVAVGEASGKLAEVFSKLHTHYNNQSKRRQQIIQALTYPILVMITSIGVICFMMLFIVPLFEDVFNRFDRELPTLTGFIIGISHNFMTIFIALISIFSTMWIGGKIALQNRTLAIRFGRFLLHVPYLGETIRDVNLARLSSAVHLLLSGGLPFAEALRMGERASGFVPLQEALTDLRETLEQGGNIYNIITNNIVFDSKFATFISIGLETGNLINTFADLEKYYTEKSAQRTATINTLLEPLLILFVGVIVAIILISMYLPMFEMSTLPN